MPTGEWCAGRTKDTDEKIKAMADKVKESCNDPDLRKRLDDKKRRKPEEILKIVAKSKVGWTLLSPVNTYVRQSTRNLLCSCPEGHQQLNSLNDIIWNGRCKTCNPGRNVGKKN